MKRNAIARIVIYSLLILILSGLLITGIGFDLLAFQPDHKTESNYAEGETVSLDAGDISRLKIDWAAGNIHILTADTDQIAFYETGNITEKYTMSYNSRNGTLEIEFARTNITVGFGNIPEKDLTITVPSDWVCRELELDAAAVNVNVDGLNVQELTLDGAAAKLSFRGQLDRMDIDGASVEMDIHCTSRPSQIDIDGASCEMELYLPEDCGFLVQMDGLSCSFDSDLDYTTGSGDYMYGDRYCKVNIDGLSCDITVNHTPVIMEVK